MSIRSFTVGLGVESWDQITCATGTAGLLCLRHVLGFVLDDIVSCGKVGGHLLHRALLLADGTSDQRLRGCGHVRTRDEKGEWCRGQVAGCWIKLKQQEMADGQMPEIPKQFTRDRVSVYRASIRTNIPRGNDRAVLDNTESWVFAR